MTITLAYVVTLCLVRVAIWLIVKVYYSDSDRMLKLLRLQSSASETRGAYHKRWDSVLATFPFLWTWLDILIVVSVAQYASNWVTWILVSVVVGGRFRALQEFGHNAVHFAMCKSHRWQYLLSEVFCQAPLFKPEMQIRQHRHSGQHHPNPNQHGKDPNFAKVVAGCMVPGISVRQFRLNLFHPFRVSTLKINLFSMGSNVFAASSLKAGVTRCLAICSTAAILYLHAGFSGVIWAWLFPVATFYQLFAWWALLAEHRWHVESDAPTRIEREYASARPTDYAGLSGLLTRCFIAPTSDAYHLVHSLYPHVRWNYLPAIDRWLKVNDARYTENASMGFFFSRNGIPSALSELQERLTSTKLNTGTTLDTASKSRPKEMTHV